MARMVALLGTSPGTVHTTLCKLLEMSVKVDEVVIYATLQHAAEEAVEILRRCPCPGTGETPLRPGVRVETRLLGFEDVHGPEDLERLRISLRPVLRGALLDVTGGRKAMAIAAALEGYRSGATVVATVIPREEYKRIQSAAEPCGKVARSARLLVL